MSMKRQDRAKQFMPFAALKGYEEALRQRENSAEPRIVPGEDRAEELDRKLRSLSEGSFIRVRHYRRRCYVTTEGVVDSIMDYKRKLRIGSEEIKYSDIVELEII